MRAEGTVNPVEPLVATRHEYRLRNAQSVPSMVIGVIMVAAAVPITWLLLTSANPSSATTLVVLDCAMLGTGAWLLSWVLRSRLVLENNQLRVCNGGLERVYDASQIDGVRSIPVRYGSIPMLCLRGSSTRIQYSRFATDEFFRTWLAQFPDFDEQERKAILDQITQDQELGATPEERLGALTVAKTWSIGLSIVAGLAAAGFVFGPAEAKLPLGAALLLTPVIVMVLLHGSPHIYAFFKRRADPRAELMFPVALAAPALLIGSLQVFPAAEINLISFSPLLVWILVVVAVFLLAFYRSAQANFQPSRAVFSLLVLAALFGAGAAMWADVWGDQAPPALYRAQVIEKYYHVSSGRSRSTTYYLETDEWGPELIRRVQVSRPLYRNTSAGDSVCLSRKPGLLHAPWYQAMACPAPE